MTLHTSSHVNGLDIEVLGRTVDAIRNDPELANCHFHIRNRWIDAARNRTTITSFYAAREEQMHKRPFELEADEPPMLAGNDDAHNPVEHLLNALAGCMTTSMVAHAAVRGINIQEVQSEIEGDIDIRGFLGLADVPKGYQNIRVRFNVKADGVDLNQLQRFAESSPVFNTLTHGCNVELQVQPKA